MEAMPNKRSEMISAPSTRFLLALETGELILVERQGQELSARLTMRDELLARYPALYVQLRLSNNRDAPFIVEERAR